MPSYAFEKSGLADQLHRFGVACPPADDYGHWRQFLRRLAPMARMNRKKEARALLRPLHPDSAEDIG